MEKHSVSKFIGSPPGYVGYSEGGAGNGLLINAIDTNSSCVLLIDEIEKAHEDVLQIFLQIMDDGRLTSSSGKVVYFRNVILIMTTNAGVAAAERNAIGFRMIENVESIDQKAIKRTFTPEFRNRLDAIITFDLLRRESMLRIVDKFIVDLDTLASARSVFLNFDHQSKEWLADRGFDPAMGARPLARVIHNNVKKPLSRLMLMGSLKNGGIASVTVVDDQIVVSGSPANTDDLRNTVSEHELEAS